MMPSNLSLMKPTKEVRPNRKGDSIIFVSRIASADRMQHNALVINKEDAEVIGGFADLNSSSIEAKQNSTCPCGIRRCQKVLAHAGWSSKPNLCTQPNKGWKTLFARFGHWRYVKDFELDEKSPT